MNLFLYIFIIQRDRQASEQEEEEGGGGGGGGGQRRGKLSLIVDYLKILHIYATFFYPKIYLVAHAM